MHWAGLEGRRRASPVFWRAAPPPIETLACQRERKRGFGGVVRLPRLIVRVRDG